MADRVEAIARGPISFCSAGKQELISGRSIYFEGGAIATDTKLATAEQDAALLRWLGFLAKQGLIVKGKPLTPPAAKLFTVNAAVPGANGNAIAVEFSTTANPAEIVVAVAAEETYDDLSLDTLEVTLGKVGGPDGTRPGLTRVKTVGAAPPVDGVATRKAGPPVTWEIADGATPAGVAFVLQEWKPDNKGRLAVAVSNTRAVAGKTLFTLAITWSHEVTVAQGDLTNLADLGFAVTFDPAPATGWTALPALTPVELDGGDEPAAARRAHADVLVRT